MEDDVERTKLNNTDNLDTKEDIVMGLSKLPGPGESERDTIHAIQS